MKHFIFLQLRKVGACLHNLFKSTSSQIVERTDVERKVIFSNIIEDTDVHFSWLLCLDLDNYKLSKELLGLVTEMWITVSGSWTSTSCMFFFSMSAVSSYWFHCYRPLNLQWGYVLQKCCNIEVVIGSPFILCLPKELSVRTYFTPFTFSRIGISSTIEFVYMQCIVIIIILESSCILWSDTPVIRSPFDV